MTGGLPPQAQPMSQPPAPRVFRWTWDRIGPAPSGPKPPDFVTRRHDGSSVGAAKKASTLEADSL